VNELVTISGRTHEDCVKALRAVQMIPDLAFELLLSGQPIPDRPLIPPAGGAQGQDMGGEDDGAYGDEEGSGDLGAGLANFNLDPQTEQAIHALVNNPSFPMIRQRMI